MTKPKKIHTGQHAVVRQSNKMSQTGRAESSSVSLSRYQKRFLLMMISKIGYNDTEFRTETMSLIDFMNIMGIPDGGDSRKRIKKSVSDLFNRNFLVDTEEGYTVPVCWLDFHATRIDWNKNEITTKLSDDLKEYYLQVRKCYTSFQLGYTTKFKKKYTYRLYEYLHSYKTQKTIVIDLERAYEILCDNKYHNITDFERFVLRTAIDEINTFSDLKVSYIKKKLTGKYSHLCFTVNVKSKKELETIKAMWGKKDTLLLQLIKDKENEEDHCGHDAEEDESYNSIMKMFNDNEDDVEYDEEDLPY